MKVQIKGQYTDYQVQRAIARMNQHLEAAGSGRITGYEILQPKGEVVGDSAPCSDCGNTVFIRTGTCHVCQICGASQGCS